MKLSDLRTAAEIREQDMLDPEYKREYDRLKLASDVAIRVLAYRTQQRISQTELARRLGVRQPHIARLESGEHEPSLATLARLSSVLGIDFSVDITPGGACLAAIRASVPARRRERASAVRADVASSAPSAVLTQEARMTASPGRDQKAARLRDLERLRELVCPYSTDTAAPIGHAIARMPAGGQAEAREILARIGAIGEDPEQAAARQRILADIALAGTCLREILGRPHYKIRNGRVVTDPATGEPMRDDRAVRQARALLSDMELMRSRLTGLAPATDSADDAQ